MNAKAVAEALHGAVKRGVAGEIAALREQIKALEQREVPTPLNGKDGINGKDGRSATEEEIKAAAAAWLEAHPPKDGSKGLDAPAPTPEQLAPLVTAWLKANPPASGKDGKDAPPVSVEAIAKCVAEFIRENPPAAGPDGRDGRDGIDGRDAIQIEIVDLDEAKSYPRATFGTWKGGLLKALRTTDPLKGGEPERKGWQIVMNGVSEIQVEQDGERSFRVRTLTTNGKSQEIVATMPVVIDRGVYKPGTYEKGDGATFGGSFWIAQRSGELGKPGECDDWRLGVKRGRDGKDGKDGTNGRDGKTLSLGAGARP